MTDSPVGRKSDGMKPLVRVVLKQEETEETEKGPILCFLCYLLFETPVSWL